MRRFVVLLVVAVACGGDPVDPVRVLDEPLPVLSGTDLDGNALSTESYEGSVLVLNAWASYCAPCERETPMLVRMAERYEDEGVRFLGIDHIDQPAEGTRFVERYDVPYPSFADLAGRFAAVLGYPGLPATYIVDADGTMRFAVYDEIQEDTLVRLLDQVLAEGRPATPSP